MKHHYLPPSADCDIFMKRLLADTAVSNSILHLSPGQYIFHKANTESIQFPISNTISAIHRSASIRHFALALKKIYNFTIDGNGAELWFDGDLTPFALFSCNNILLQNFSVNFLRPRVSEMTLIAVQDNYADFQIAPDSRFTLDEENRFCWINADGNAESPESLVVQCASSDGQRNLRCNDNPLLDAQRAEIIGKNRLRLYFSSAFRGKIRDIYQFRDPTRNEVGILIDHCSGVELDHLRLHFTPGLGVIAQMSQDIKIRNIVHAPHSESGRVCAAFADCIQISSCRGDVEISDCRFSGAHDDAINVHGTYLELVRQNEQMVTAEFKHPETWGIVPFEPGDRIALVNAGTLERLEYRTLTAAEKINDLQIRLTLDAACTRYPCRIVIENRSAYPDVLIRRNHFQGYPTRGLLLSSAGKCIVRENIFLHASNSPVIYISGDAGSWFESGGVTDVEISDNLFIGGGRCPAISVLPETAPESQGIVHRNIRIFNNRFQSCKLPYLAYRNTAELSTDIPDSAVKGKG